MRDFRPDRNTTPILLTCALLGSGMVCADPVIEITGLPTYGVNGFVDGTVSGVAPTEFRVAPFIQIEGVGWWTKPSFATPTVPIAADGSFTADVASGGLDDRATIFCVYLVPQGVSVPLAEGSGRVPAALDSLSVAHACREQYARTFDFAGRTWGIKEAPSPVGPGGNRFSDREADVYVDDKGQLHLWLRFRDSNWWSTEIILTESFGFGSYLFRTESDVDRLDPGAVFGAFLWDSYGDETTVPASPHREIDSEDTRWGNAADPNGSQWAIAPYWPAATVHRYALPELGSPPTLTRIISWTADELTFTALAGAHTPCTQAAGDLIDTYTYAHNPSLSQYVPGAGRERFRFNLWLNDPAGPTDGQDIEIVIGDFAFFPAGDSDCDSVAQASDNCTAVANANQRDTNADGFGNRCDADLNNDCTVDFIDLGLFKSVFLSADAEADLDGNGTVDFIDLGIVKAGFLAPPGPSALAHCP